MYELCRDTERGIFAIPYRGRLAHKALRLPDGAIVEATSPEQRREAPDRVPTCLGMANGDVPATIHHAQLGLVVAFLPLSGVYLLPDGDVAAVYGAKAVPIGAATVAVR